MQIKVFIINDGKILLNTIKFTAKTIIMMMFESVSK